jgi:hypothetical protein
VPQVWTDYAEQLRGIAGKMVTPAVTQGLAEAAADIPAAPPAPSAALDLQGVMPPAAMEAAVQEPALPVEAIVAAEPEVEAETQAQAAAAATAPSKAEAAPEVSQAVQEVTEVINNVAKAAPVISAAATPDPKTLAKSAMVPKAAGKANRAQSMQKSAPSGKSAGRSRKS